MKTIWERLDSRRITQKEALRLFNNGVCVGMLSTKNTYGHAFNPLYSGFLNPTMIQDHKDDLRRDFGGAVEWYNLEGCVFNFENRPWTQFSETIQL